MTIATVFLLTSLKEGMPNVLMEAQLSGTPIVATEISGTASVVKSGETALLRPVGDVAGLAQACVRLMSDRESAKRMGQAGQHHVHEAFSPDLLVARYIALLQGKNTSVTGSDVTPSGLARMALAAPVDSWRSMIFSEYHR